MRFRQRMFIEFFEEIIRMYLVHTFWQLHTPHRAGTDPTKFNYFKFTRFFIYLFIVFIQSWTG